MVKNSRTSGQLSSARARRKKQKNRRQDAAKLGPVGISKPDPRRLRRAGTDGSGVGVRQRRALAEARRRGVDVDRLALLTDRQRRRENSDNGFHQPLIDEAMAAIERAVEGLDVEDLTTDELDERLDTLEDRLHWALENARDNIAEDTFNDMLARLNVEVSRQLVEKGLDGWAIAHSATDRRYLVRGPPPASSRGFSGSSRSDKAADLPPDWDTYRIGNVADWANYQASRQALHQIRHVTFNYGNHTTETNRRPGQSTAMAHVDHRTLGLPAHQNSVSPNLVRHTEQAATRRSSEWLHLSARSDGSALQFHDDLAPSARDAMPTDNTPFTRNPPQNPRNLVAGSYAANTMMMALERAGREAENKVKFTKEIRALTSDPTKPHEAELIEYTIRHETGIERTYLINARPDSVAPLPDYLDMELDAQRFFENPGAFRGLDPAPQNDLRSIFQYLGTRAVQQLLGADLSTEQMRDQIKHAYHSP